MLEQQHIREGLDFRTLNGCQRKPLGKRQLLCFVNAKMHNNICKTENKPLCILDKFFSHPFMLIHNMSDLLVYVNETVSCSVIFDSSDVILETFRQEILNTQVDDVLNFPYKFTRSVNNNRVVVGLKQERLLKLKQCMEESAEGQAAIYLVCDKTNSEQPDVQEVSASPSKHDEELPLTPPTKKAKISRQPTLFDMCSPNRSTVSPQPYSAARARKVKIFSVREIDDSTGMQKLYRTFWNTKAEELCRSSALKTFKPGEIQGAINVAWIIEKTEHLKNEMENVNKEINDKCPVDILKKFQLSAKTLEKNREHIETAIASVQDLQRELTSARQEHFDSSSKSERRATSVRVDELEKNLESQLAEMRKSQDSLRKAIDARRKLLHKLDVAEESNISPGEDSDDDE